MLCSIAWRSAQQRARLHAQAAHWFDFVSLEHTSKNKLILAVKREHAPRRDELLQQVGEI